MSKLLLLENGVEILTVLSSELDAVDVRMREINNKVQDILEDFEETPNTIKYLDEIYLKEEDLRNRVFNFISKIQGVKNFPLGFAARLNALAKVAGIFTEEFEDEGDSVLKFFGDSAQIIEFNEEGPLSDRYVVTDIDFQQFTDNLSLLNSKITEAYTSLENPSENSKLSDDLTLILAFRSLEKDVREKEISAEKIIPKVKKSGLTIHEDNIKNNFKGCYINGFKAIYKPITNELILIDEDNSQITYELVTPTKLTEGDGISYGFLDSYNETFGYESGTDQSHMYIVGFDIEIGNPLLIDNNTGEYVLL